MTFFIYCVRTYEAYKNISDSIDFYLDFMNWLATFAQNEYIRIII